MESPVKFLTATKRHPTSTTEQVVVLAPMDWSAEQVEAAVKEHYPLGMSRPRKGAVQDDQQCWCFDGYID
jgi:hypothetical protein